MTKEKIIKAKIVEKGIELNFGMGEIDNSFINDKSFYVVTLDYEEIEFPEMFNTTLGKIEFVCTYPNTGYKCSTDEYLYSLNGKYYYLSYYYYGDHEGGGLDNDHCYILREENYENILDSKFLLIECEVEEVVRRKEKT